MLSAPNPLEFIIFRIKTAAFGCARVYPNGRASHEISNKKHCKCFQHVRPPTFRAKFHHSSMAMMTCQLSPCERYHPVRRRWNHFIIYKSHPSTWCLRLPMGSKIFLAFQYSLPIQDVTRHMWAPQNRRILFMMQSGPLTENITPSVRGIINNEPWTIVFFVGP